MAFSRTFRIALACFGIALIGVLTSGLLLFSSPHNDALRGSASVPPRDVSGVRITDVNNQETSFTPKSNGITLTFFGFTHCPDVCPTTLSDIRTALGDIGKTKADRVTVAMVSIDPVRDTGPVLHNYLHQFFDDRTGLALRTDDPAHLQQVASAFGASYNVTPSATPGGEPEVSHTAWLYAVDSTGHIRDQWSFGAPAKDLAHDLGVLLS